MLNLQRVLIVWLTAPSNEAQVSQQCKVPAYILGLGNTWGLEGYDRGQFVGQNSYVQRLR